MMDSVVGPQLLSCCGAITRPSMRAAGGSGIALGVADGAGDGVAVGGAEVAVPAAGNVSTMAAGVKVAGTVGVGLEGTSVPMSIPGCVLPAATAGAGSAVGSGVVTRSNIWCGRRTRTWPGNAFTMCGSTQKPPTPRARTKVINNRLTPIRLLTHIRLSPLQRALFFSPVVYDRTVYQKIIIICS